MTELIACLSSGEGTWIHVANLIKGMEWDKIILITNNFGKENFKPEKQAEFVVVDFKKPLLSLIEDIKNSLKGKIKGIEVAVNIASGEGKEHMAIMSALLNLGIGIRFVALTTGGIKEI